MLARKLVCKAIVAVCLAQASAAWAASPPMEGAVPHKKGAHTPKAPPSALPSATPSVSPSPSPSPTVSPSPSPSPLSRDDAKKLRKQFVNAQSTALKALEFRHKMELKELDASQNARMKEWDAREREARRKFFAENSKGSDKRAYIKDLLARRETFRKIMADERARMVQEQKVRYKSTQGDQASKLKEFDEVLSRGEIPSPRLWP